MQNKQHWYLGYANGTDRSDRVRITLPGGIMSILLQGSAGLVRNRRVEVNSPFYCKKIIRGQGLYLAPRGSWSRIFPGNSEHSKLEAELTCSGIINRVFYDTKRRIVLVTGIWNDSSQFHELDEVQINRQGLIGEHYNPLMFVLSEASDFEEFSKMFQKNKDKIILGQFSGLLEKATYSHYNAKVLVNILSGNFIAMPERYKERRDASRVRFARRE